MKLYIALSVILIFILIIFVGNKKDNMTPIKYTTIPKNAAMHGMTWNPDYTNNNI